MSKIKPINPITEQEISAAGVVSLAVRPNQRQSGSQYGEGNLSAKELQKRFDRLARLAISRCNMLTQLLSGEYIPNVQNDEKESILEYILVVKAEDSELGADMSLADVFAEILTTDGQLKAIDPTTDDGALAELNTVITNLYKSISKNTEDIKPIQSNFPAKMHVGAFRSSGSAVHYFQFAREDGTIIDDSIAQIDLFIDHNKDDNAHKNKFSSIETTINANKIGLQQQIDNCQARVDSVNTLLDTDDETLDELQEIVNYIKSNKSLIDAITTSKVSKTSQTANRVAYVNDKGADTTVPIINDVKEDKVKFNAYSIACRNENGCLTVANAVEDYDAVNKKTMDAALAAQTPNIDLEELKTELDKRYAKLSDLEACFAELHEYAQGIILGVDE